MACFHPLPAIKKPYPDNRFKVGRENQEFLPYTDRITGEYIEQIKVPCGKCIGCRLDYSRTWANRCVLESLSFPQETCFFVTLTYSDESIKEHSSELISPKGTLTLYPKHVQDFMKRLRIHWQRKYNHDGIRFYLAGEYGDETARPHYHALIYNIPIKDLTFYAKNNLGQPLFNSGEIEDIWGFGYVVLGELNWDTCAYTARYVMKKQKGKGAKDFYENAGLYPEFVRMSRDPGIGRLYFEANKDKIYRTDSIVLPGGKVVKPPAYFDKLYSLEHPEIINDLKIDRRYCAEMAKQNRLLQCDYDEKKYFSILEENKNKSVKGLTRYL